MHPSGSARAIALSALTVLTLSGGCAPSYKLAPFEDVSIELADYPLPSRMRLVFHRDARVPVVRVTTLVGVGSGGVPPQLDGLAPLVERLTLHAAPDGGDPISAQLDAIGASYSARVTPDYTVSITVAPAARLEDLLRIEGRRLAAPLAGVDAADFALERDRQTDAQRRRSTHGALDPLRDTLDTLLFPPGHPQRRPLLGDARALAALTLDDARAFAERAYVPENITIVISGDIDFGAVAGQVAAAMPPALLTADGQPARSLTRVEPRPGRLRPEPAAPTPPVERVRRLTGPVARPTLVIGWALPGRFSGHAAAMRAVAHHTADKLYQEMQPRSDEVFRHVDDIECDLDMGVRASVLRCVVVAVPGVDLEALLGEALAATAFDEPGERARLSQQAADDLTGDALALDLARQAHFLGRVDVYRDLREGAAVTWGTPFVYTWFDPDRRAALIVEPDPALTPLPALDLPEARWREAALDPRLAPADRYAPLPPGAIEALARSSVPAGIEMFTLPQGLPVVLVPVPGALFVRVALVASAGRSSSPAGISYVVVPGSLTKDISAFLGRWRDHDGATSGILGVEAPTGNLPAALHALAARLDSLFVSYENKRWRQAVDHITAVHERRAPIRAVRAYEEARRALYPDHPAGRMRSDPAVAARLGVDDLEAWLHRLYAPANTTLVVVGGYDPATVRPLSTRYFGDWRADDRGAPIEHPPPPPPVERQIIFEEAAAPDHATLTVLCRLDTAPDADVTRAVLADLLEAGLTRALQPIDPVEPRVAIVEASALTAHLEVTVDVDPAHTGAALDAITGALAAGAAGDTSVAALREAQARSARRSQRHDHDIEASMSAITDALRIGVSIDALRTEPERLAAVDARTLARVLSPCAGREVIAAVGSSAIHASLAERAPVRDAPPASSR